MTDEVTREIELPAAPDEVWRSLTEPDRLREWLAADASVDLRPGGELIVRTCEGEDRSGWVEEADAPRRLAFWWSDDDEADSTRVELRLRGTDRGTLLTVTETRPLALLGSAPAPPQMLALR